MNRVLVIFATIFYFTLSVGAQNRAADATSLLKGSSIVGQDAKNTFLGKIDGPYAKDSIFNEFSRYGNEIYPNSIFNDINIFGGQISQYSPFNPLALKPPMIIKNGKVIGYLTVNPAITGGVSVRTLFSLKDFFH